MRMIGKEYDNEVYLSERNEDEDKLNLDSNKDFKYYRLK